MGWKESVCNIITRKIIIFYVKEFFDKIVT